MSQYLNTPQKTRATDNTEMIILSFNVSLHKIHVNQTFYVKYLIHENILRCANFYNKYNYYNL